MSLFKQLRAQIVDETNETSDLDLFIGLMQDVRNGTGEKYKAFFDVLMDSRRAGVTGSSVLGKRFNKTNIAQDIDIFVDDREDEFTGVLDSFFDKITIAGDIWPVYRDRTNSGDSSKEKDEFIDNAVLIKTSSTTYDFNIDEFKLNTFRVRLGPYLMLNFILLSDTNPTPTYSEQSPHDDYPFPERLVRNLVSKDFLQVEETGNYSTYVLSYIEKYFDFQELKTIYDFDSKSIVNVYDEAIKINNMLIEKLTTIESSKYTDRAIVLAGQHKRDLERLSDTFKEKFSNYEKVTIASSHGSRFDDINVIFRLYKEDVLHGSNFAKIANDFTALNTRIPLYQTKGFKVEDPGNVLLNLHTNIASVALSALVDPVISDIERQAIFSSDKDTKKKYLFMNRLKGLAEENEDRLGLELTRPSNDIENEIQENTF